ncbi:MAG: hypothetical protein AAGA87_06595 [Pseudomonadota bacterium]
MKVFRAIAAVCVVSISAGLPAAAQQLIERYTATIAPQDRRNSSGAPLAQPGAILAQDRANFHRFGVRQPGDTADRTFSVQQNRAAMPTLLAQGRMGPGAAEAILRGANPTVVVEVYGTGGLAQYVSVALQPQGQPTASVVTPTPTPAPQPEAQAQPQPQPQTQTQGLPTLPILSAPSGSAGGWAFSNDTHAWRGSASVSRGGDTIVTLGCTRPGAIPAQYPGGGHVRPHEPGVLNLLIEPDAMGANISGGVQNYAVTVTVDGQALGTAPVILLSPEMKLATNVPLNHPIVEALKGGGTLQLSEGTTGGQLQVALTGARAAIDALKAFCAQPVQATPTPTAALPSVAPQAPAAAAGALTTTSGLLFLGNRPVVLAGSVQSSALTGSDVAKDHERILSRRLYFSALAASSDTLEASLASVGSHSYLRTFFDLLPLEAKTRIRDFGLDLQNLQGTERQVCATAQERQLWFCASQRITTEFDSRRLAQKVAQEIAAVTRAEAIETPIEVQIFCGVTGIDRAYDFNAQTVNWGSFIQNGTCGNPNLPLNGMLRNLGQTSFDYRIGEALPEATPMAPAQVEALAQQSTTRPADRIYRPLLLGFTGRISLERVTSQRPSALGLQPVEVRFTRTGPIDLRWAGQPTQVIMQFEGMSDTQRPTDAADLMLAETIAGLLDGVAPLDPSAMAGAFAEFLEGETGGEPVQVTLPAFLNDREATPRLSLTNFTLGRQGQALATATEVPRDFLAWNQVQTRNRDFPDTEVFMAFNRPWESVKSDPIDPELARGNQVRVVAEVSYPHLTQGEVGPSLIAFVKPLYFEVTRRGVAGATKVVARVPLSAPPKQEERVRIFVPTARWYLHEAVTAAGLDLEEQLNTALEQTGIYGNDVFARLDAAEAEAKTLAQLAERNEGREPWVFGSVRLGPYDLEREGYPIQQMQVTIPARDQIDQRLSRAWTPQIDLRDVLLPIPTDRARAMRETLKPDTNYPIRARIEIMSKGVPGQSAPMAKLKEISLLPPQRGSRQPVMESAFTPGDELITFALDAE